MSFAIFRRREVADRRIGRSLLRCARLSSHHRRYISSSTSSLHSSATKNSFDIKQPTPHDYTYNSTDTEYTSPSKRKKWSWIDPKTVKVDGAPLAPRTPLPPYMTRVDAVEKTKIAERAWNTRNPEHVAQGYSVDCVMRVNEKIFRGRQEIIDYLKEKWSREHEYRLEKNMWCYQGNRIACRFEYEWKDSDGQCWRTHGNEYWEYDELGYIRWRDMSSSPIKIEEASRRLPYIADDADH